MFFGGMLIFYVKSLFSGEKISSISRLLDLVSKQVYKAKGDFTAFVSNSPGCKTQDYENRSIILANW
jgi:hypothetical protein